MKKQLKIPKFKTEDEEFAYWSKLDLAEYFDPKDLKPFRLDEFLSGHARPQTTRVTLRVPREWIRKVKDKASHLDVPYQSLLKRYIQRGLQADI